MLKLSRNWLTRFVSEHAYRLTYLSEKSSKTFCCPVSPSARRTASWKSFNGYRTDAGGVSVPFDNFPGNAVNRSFNALARGQFLQACREILVSCADYLIASEVADE